MTLCRHSAQCRAQREVYRLLVAVLVVKSDSSRKEGPATPLLHTLRVYQSVAKGAAQCCERNTNIDTSGIDGNGYRHLKLADIKTIISLLYKDLYSSDCTSAMV